MRMKQDIPEQTLEDIRQALYDIDRQRLEQDLPPEERDTLELSAVALRDLERLLIAKKQKQLIKDQEALTEEITELSRIIRARVTRMNSVPKALESVEKIFKEIVLLLKAIGKW
jgi:phosphate uptake regulator